MKRSSMHRLFVAVSAATSLMAAGSQAQGAAAVVSATYTNNAGGTQTWNTATNWSSNPDYPSGVGAAATFNGPSAARTVNTAEAITVGAITQNTDTAFDSSIGTGGGSLTFDAVGAGPATVDISGAGASRLQITVATTLNDDLVVTASNAYTGTTGALNYTGTIGGVGGFTKNGDATMTFGTGVKTYTGATVLNGGRMRMSLTAATTGTSSFTINSGGQLELVSAGSYTLGAGTLSLNGSGPVSGPAAPFPGVIRPTSNLAITITNAVNLLGTSQIVSSGASSSLTFSGNMSGIGGLLIQGAGSGNGGIVALGGTNSYGGTTTVTEGTLQALAASVNAFGTSNVVVNNTSGAAVLSIQTGATNAIADSATLSIAGGQGIVSLGAGINESVGALILGGFAQGDGTYGSTASAAQFTSDTFFSGTGIISVPEPASLAVMGLAGMALVGRRRR